MEGSKIKMIKSVEGSGVKWAIDCVSDHSQPRAWY